MVSVGREGVGQGRVEGEVAGSQTWRTLLNETISAELVDQKDTRPYGCFGSPVPVRSSHADCGKGRQRPAWR